MKSIFFYLIVLLSLNSCSSQNIKPLNFVNITNSSINNIDEKTPFEINMLAPKLLGYELKLFTAWEGGKPISIISVVYHNQDIMIISPTKDKYVKDIRVLSIYNKNPFNINIGDIYKASLPFRCKTVPNEDMICKKEGYENIELLFLKDKDNNYALAEFIWSPK